MVIERLDSHPVTQEGGEPEQERVARDGGACEVGARGGGAGSEGEGSEGEALEGEG